MTLPCSIFGVSSDALIFTIFSLHRFFQPQLSDMSNFLT